MHRSQETFSKVSQQSSKIWLIISTCTGRGEVRGWKPHSWCVFDHRLILPTLQTYSSAGTDSELAQGWATGLTQTLEETRGHFLFQCVLTTAAWVRTWFPEPGNSSKGDTVFLWNHFDFDKFVTEHKLSSVSKLKFPAGFFGSDVLFCFFRKFSWFCADHLSAPQQWICWIASGLSTPWLTETKAQYADCPKSLSLFPFLEKYT